jgi:hypothetical protein
VNLELERHLKEMGILSNSFIEGLDGVSNQRYVVLTKGHFNDPRDENGEVNF